MEFLYICLNKKCHCFNPSQSLCLEVTEEKRVIFHSIGLEAKPDMKSCLSIFPRNPGFHSLLLKDRTSTVSPGVSHWQSSQANLYLASGHFFVTPLTHGTASVSYSALFSSASKTSCDFQFLSNLLLSLSYCLSCWIQLQWINKSLWISVQDELVTARMTWQQYQHSTTRHHLQTALVRERINQIWNWEEWYVVSAASANLVTQLPAYFKEKAAWLWQWVPYVSNVITFCRKRATNATQNKQPNNTHT